MSIKLTLKFLNFNKNIRHKLLKLFYYFLLILKFIPFYSIMHELHKK